MTSSHRDVSSLEPVLTLEKKITLKQEWVVLKLVNIESKFKLCFLSCTILEEKTTSKCILFDFIFQKVRKPEFRRFSTNDRGPGGYIILGVCR